MLARARLYLDFPGIEDGVWYNINSEGPHRCPRDSGMSGYPFIRRKKIPVRSLWWKGKVGFCGCSPKMTVLPLSNHITLSMLINFSHLQFLFLQNSITVYEGNSLKVPFIFPVINYDSVVIPLLLSFALSKPKCPGESGK